LVDSTRLSSTDRAFLARLDGVAQAELVRCGELSAAELLTACAERIAALDPLLNAVVTLDIERARGAPIGTGPFAGVPTLVKDVTPYPGLRWGMGSRLFAQHQFAQSSPFSERLDQSGLVIVGKSTTSEFGLLGSTETLAAGVTHNPWELSYSAAGSSGGAAVAVAAGLVPLAHANDGGGSTRIPASVCGLFGFKPSRGRCVPANAGSSDFSALVSDLCISRSVRDSALFLAVTEARGGSLPEIGYVQRPLERRLRLGVSTRTALGEEPDPEVRVAFDEAVELCVALGHEIVPALPHATDGEALGEAFFLVAGAAMSGMVETVGQTRGRAVSRDELEPFTWSLIEAFRRRGPSALPSARAAFELAGRAYRTELANYDALLTPTLALKPWRLGFLSPLAPPDELRARTARAIGYTPIHNVVGSPGMSVPLHWSADGLPIGVHFAANTGDDQLLLELAYQLEAARPWADRWAPVSFPRLFGS